MRDILCSYGLYDGRYMLHAGLKKVCINMYLSIADDFLSIKFQISGLSRTYAALSKEVKNLQQLNTYC